MVNSLLTMLHRISRCISCTHSHCNAFGELVVWVGSQLGGIVGLDQVGVVLVLER